MSLRMRVDDLVPDDRFRGRGVDGGIGRGIGGCYPNKELLGVPIEERCEI